MVNPSGVFTETALNFLSCAAAEVEVAAAMRKVREIPTRLRRDNGLGMSSSDFLKNADSPDCASAKSGAYPDGEVVAGVSERATPVSHQWRAAFLLVQRLHLDD